MKKTILIMIMSVGITMIGNAGYLTVTESAITYEFEFGRPADSIFFINYSFGETTLTSEIEAGDLSFITSTNATDQSVVINSGGSVGDNFVAFEIDLGSEDEDRLDPEDKFTLDSSQFGLDSTSYTVTVTIRRDNPTTGSLVETEESGTYSPPTPTPTPEPTPAPETPIMVPTLTEWGLLLTALIILSLGVFAIRKKHNRI